MKVIVQNGRVMGAVLIGETGLEETFEQNLIKWTSPNLTSLTPGLTWKTTLSSTIFLIIHVMCVLMWPCKVTGSKREGGNQSMIEEGNGGITRSLHSKMSVGQWSCRYSRYGGMVGEGNGGIRIGAFIPRRLWGMQWSCRYSGYGGSGMICEGMEGLG